MNNSICEKNIQHYDLFEKTELQPVELSNVLEKYTHCNGMSYSELNILLAECEKIGFTFDYYLDAEPYGLRPLGIELNQLEGWENIQE